jgi:hypothetical protein
MYTLTGSFMKNDTRKEYPKMARVGRRPRGASSKKPKIEIKLTKRISKKTVAIKKLLGRVFQKWLRSRTIKRVDIPAIFR